MKNFTYISCPLCSSKSYNIIYKSTLKKNDFDLEIIKKNLKNSLDDYTKHGQIVRCKNCTLVYVNPVENIKKILKGYEAVIDPEYIATEKYRKSLLSEHLQKIEKYKSTGKILDVGCFAGFFLSLAKKHSWKIYGIEPSTWAASIAKKHGVLIFGKEIEKVNLPQNYFDVITMWDVIEHLSNPRPAIKKIFKSLTTNGVIAVGTPNVDSLFAKILGKRYPFYIRMHLVLFSPKTLKRLLEEEGFTILEACTYGRIFPFSYILDRIQTNNLIYTYFKKIVKSVPLIANYSVRLDFRDSFILIAKKGAKPS